MTVEGADAKPDSVVATCQGHRLNIEVGKYVMEA